MRPFFYFCHASLSGPGIYPQIRGILGSHVGEIKDIWYYSDNCCESTRLRSRLISVAYLTSLGSLRQKPSSFEIFGCLYITAFASISSNRNRGSFDSQELSEEKILFRVESHVFAVEEFEASEGCTNSHD